MTEIDSGVQTQRLDRTGSTKEAVGTAASDAASTAKDQASEVVSEVKTQTRNVLADARERVGGEMRSQNDRLSEQIRRFADELDEMRRDRGDSPAGNVVGEVANGGRRLADYLSEHGPDGVMHEVQDFARRRPGTFLAVAATAGFVVGRLGKGVLKAGSDSSGTGSAPGSGPGSGMVSGAGVTSGRPVPVPEADPWFGGPQPPASTETFGTPVNADVARTPDGDMREPRL
jgi:ElaB/YqjD/DUF883 family membrane-anchored ribosome-binding protein